MEDFIMFVFNFVVIGGIILAAIRASNKKQQKPGTPANSQRPVSQYQAFGNKAGKYESYTNKPGKYDTYNKKPGKYDTFNKKSIFNTSGAQPHVHETMKYTSMSDASKLPPGYILVNGEPVRVADLEGK